VPLAETANGGQDEQGLGSTHRDKQRYQLKVGKLQSILPNLSEIFKIHIINREKNSIFRNLH
jgi:hypothetical protein